MNKIAFLNQICQISTDNSRNTENFNLAMGYDLLLNAAYEVLKVIADTYKTSGILTVFPIEFKEPVIVPLLIYFRFTSRKTAIIENCPYTIIQDDIRCIIEKNPSGAGYILTLDPL